MQRALLSAAIALILVLVTALVGPLFVDWGRFRTAFETEISHLTRLDVRIGGPIDVRLLPTPTLKLQQIGLGRPDGPTTVRVEVLRIELALGPLMRGQFMASDVALEAPEISLAFGGPDRLDWASPSFAVDPNAVSIARLAIERGRITLADGTGGSLVLDGLGFSGEMRSLLGPAKGEGSVAVDGKSYLFNIAADRAATDGTLKVRLLVDSVDRVRIGDVDSAIWIERGIPHFAGTMQWSQAAGRSAQGLNEQWRVSARMRGDWSTAVLDNINLQYGPEDRAVQLRGRANLTLQTQPKLDVALAATRIDLDRMLALPAAVRRRPLAALRTVVDSFSPAKLPSVRMNFGISAEAVTLAEESLQQVRVNLRGEGGAWDLDSLEMRAPGGTQLQLHGRLDLTARGPAFAGQGRIDTKDSRTLASWLAAGGDGGAFAGPFRAEADVRLGEASIVFDRFKAEFNRDTLEGNFAYSGPAADQSARIAATLRASNLDLDRAYALVQHIAGDTTLAWPHEGALSLNVGRTSISGIEAKGADVRLQFNEQALTVERLAVDDFAGARVAAAGSIDIRTLAPRGAITLDLDVRAADGVAALVEKFNAPAAAVLRDSAPRLLPAKLQGSLASDAQAAQDAGMAAGAGFKIAGRAGAFTLDLHGVAEVASNGSLLSTFTQLGSEKMAIAGRVDARDGRTLVETVGLDRLVSVDDRTGRLNFTASGRLDGPIVASAQVTAGGLDVSMNGTLQAARSQAATANLELSVEQANMRVPQAGTLPTTLKAHVNYDDGAIALEQMTGTIAGSSIAGRLAIGRPPTMRLDGDIKLGAVDLPAAIAAAVGVPAQRSGGSAWSADPFAGGVLGQLKGRIAVESARTTVAPDLVAANLHGVLNLDPSEVALNDFEAGFGGGRISGRLAFERDGGELGTSGRVRLTKVDMAALFRGDRPPMSGKLSLDADIKGRGRSPVALVGSLQGNGSFRIEDGRLARLDPSAFDVVIRGVDQGLPIEATRIAERMEAALGRGPLSIQGDGSITAAAGKASLTLSRLRAEDADLALSARYDLVADALDARLTLVAPARIGGAENGRPEIAINLRGPIDSPRRTLEVAALSNWLSARAIVQNEKRLAAASRPIDTRPVDPRPVEAPPTSPPTARPAVPANSAAVAKPTQPSDEAKTGASAAPPDVAKPPPAAGAVAAVKPEAPVNPPVKPAPDTSAPAKPELPSDQLSAARETAAVGIPGKPNVAPAESPADPGVAELDRAIASNPNDGAALARRGQMFALRGNYGSAIKDFDAVIRLRPRDAEAFNNRCWARAVVGDLEAALRDCDAALQLNPRYADAFDSRGMINLKSGQLGKAIADYDAALRINPKLASSLYGRGIARVKNDNPAAGNRDIAEAKSIQANIAEEFAGYGIR